MEIMQAKVLPLMKVSDFLGSTLMLRQFFTEIDDTVQAPQIEKHTAVSRGHARTVSPVLAATDRIEGNAEAVGHGQAILHLRAVSRTQNGGHLPFRGERRLLDRSKPALIEDDVFTADDCRPLQQSVIEVRQCHLSAQATASPAGEPEPAAGTSKGTRIGCQTTEGRSFGQITGTVCNSTPSRAIHSSYLGLGSAESKRSISIQHPY